MGKTEIPITGERAGAMVREELFGFPRHSHGLIAQLFPITTKEKETLCAEIISAVICGKQSRAVKYLQLGITIWKEKTGNTKPVETQR